eukprot:57551_1
MNTTDEHKTSSDWAEAKKKRVKHPHESTKMTQSRENTKFFQKTIRCKYWDMGYCHRGTNCFYIHHNPKVEPAPKPAPPTRVDLNTTGEDGSRVRFKSGNAWSKPTSLAPRIHTEPASATSMAKPSSRSELGGQWSGRPTEHAYGAPSGFVGPGSGIYSGNASELSGEYPKAGSQWSGIQYNNHVNQRSGVQAEYRNQWSVAQPKYSSDLSGIQSEPITTTSETQSNNTNYVSGVSGVQSDRSQVSGLQSTHASQVSEIQPKPATQVSGILQRKADSRYSGVRTGKIKSSWAEQSVERMDRMMSKMEIESKDSTSDISSSRPLNAQSPSFNSESYFYGAPGMEPSQLSKSNGSSKLKATNPDMVRYSEIAGSKNPSDSPHKADVDQLKICPFFTKLTCRYAENCKFRHAFPNGVCPNCGSFVCGGDAEHRKHIGECSESAVLASEYMASAEQNCGICLENILGAGRKFGLLLNCTHAFCLNCIREWRGSLEQNIEAVRSCPVCRVKSHFILPSDRMIFASDRKQKLTENYKNDKSKVPCKHFSRNETCPFGSSCFYAHILKNGEVAPKLVPRKMMNENEEVVIMKSTHLSDFLG